MGYLKFFILVFQYFVTDLTTNSLIKNLTTFRLQQDMAGGSKLTTRTKRTPLFFSSNDKRSLCSISRPKRHYNRRSATLKQRNRNLFFNTSANESDMEMTVEHQNCEPVEPVAHRTRARKYSNQNYKQYLTHVLRKINDTTDQPMVILSSNAMECMSNFMVDVFNRIALEAGQQVKKRKTKTLGEWDIKSAFKIVMPDELGVHEIALAYRKMQKTNNDRNNANSVLVTFNPESTMLMYKI